MSGTGRRRIARAKVDALSNTLFMLLAQLLMKWFVKTAREDDEALTSADLRRGTKKEEGTGKIAGNSRENPFVRKGNNFPCFSQSGHKLSATLALGWNLFFTCYFFYAPSPDRGWEVGGFFEKYLPRFYGWVSLKN